MSKHSKVRQFPQKQPYKKKNPAKTPFIFKLLAAIAFIVILALEYPDFSMQNIVRAAIGCIICYAVAAVIWYVRYRVMLSGASIERIDKMGGEEFEDYLATLYRKHGYWVKMTPKTCDFGADLLITDKKTGKKICVQAKRYRGLVGEAAVQQTLSGREYYKCDSAVIITNSHFTDAAKALAKKCDIKIIDRYKLGKEDMYLL